MISAFKPGATLVDLLTDSSLQKRLHAFPSNKKENSLESSPQTLTLRPIQGALGNISYLGRLTMLSTPAESAMGSSTGMNAVGGTLDLMKACEAQKRAEEIRDKKEGRIACIGWIEGSARAAAGVSYCFFRSSKIYCAVKNSSIGAAVSNVAGRIAYFSGLIGDIGFAISFALDFGVSSYRFYKTRKFNHSFDNSESVSPSEGFQFLAKKLIINSSAQLQKIHASWDQLPNEVEKNRAIQAFKEDLKERALDALSKEELVIHAYTNGRLSLSKTRSTFQQYFNDLKKLPSLEASYKAEYAASLNLTLEECQDLSLVELIGFFVEEKKRGERKEAKMIRRTSPACVEAIRKAANRGLLRRLEQNSPIGVAAQKEYQILSSTVHTSGLSNQKKHLAMAVMCLVGLSVTLMGLLSLAGVCIAPPLGLLLIFGLLMVFVDIESLKGALNYGPVGKRDKLYLFFITFFLLCSFATSVGLVLGLHLALKELIKAGGIFLLGSGLNLYTFTCLNKRAKAWKESHLDLEGFKQKLLASPEGLKSEEINTLFKKLPKEDRLAIREAYKLLPIEPSKETHFYNPKTDSERALFQKGVKKTLKQYWKQLQEDKTLSVDTAYKIESLLYMGPQEDRVAAIKAFNEKIATQIQENVRYVFKREESQQQLLKVIEGIQHPV